MDRYGISRNLRTVAVKRPLSGGIVNWIDTLNFIERTSAVERLDMRIFRLPAPWILLVLGACSPGDGTPPSGSVTLEYASTSESLDAVTFVLANGTARAVYFRGSPDPVPGTLSMSCYSSGTASGYGQALVDPAPTEKTIEVGPNQRVRLRLWASVPSDIKTRHGTCRLNLTLEGGSVVESREFVP
jgi:hypothetical protein